MFSTSFWKTIQLITRGTRDVNSYKKLSYYVGLGYTNTRLICATTVL